MENDDYLSNIKNICMHNNANGWEVSITMQNGNEIKKSGVKTPDSLKEAINDYLIELIDDPEENNDPRIPSYIHEMKRMFDRNYASPISLDMLEEKLDISKYRLCHEFKQYIKKSPKQYLIQRRLNAARILLINTNMKIYEIALNVGYDNINNFITAFRKQYNTTPSEYRREQQ